MQPNELDWLSKHMGHNVEMHKQKYRLHNAACEITKIGRLLMAIDGGTADAYHGRRLHDIEPKGTI